MTPNQLLDEESLNELEKYDIWNWGDRETFRQLIIDKCGEDIVDSTVMNALEDISNTEILVYPNFKIDELKTSLHLS